MGICNGKISSGPKAASDDEMAKSKALSKQMAEDKKRQQNVIKLLLLGTGESGKSTLFKQMLAIHGKPFNVSDRQEFLRVIQNNAIMNMKAIIAQAPYIKNHESNRKTRPIPEIQCKDSYDFIGQVPDDTKDETAGYHIERLWKDPAIQDLFDMRASYQLGDSAAYFFQKVKDIFTKDYAVTEEDVLRSRVRTTGIIEDEFSVNETKFKMFDVGGQRNERKKWIHCFEAVTAVMFVAAISEYNQKLFEDDAQNRLQEALTLWGEIVSSKYFMQSSMILFLNKSDVFADKILKWPLQEHQLDYTPPPPHEIYEYHNDLESAQKGLEDGSLTSKKAIEKIQEVFQTVRGLNMMPKSFPANFAKTLESCAQELTDGPDALEKVKKAVGSTQGTLRNARNTLIREDAQNWITNQFRSRPQDKKRQDAIYTHVTCATNTENVRYIFNDVKSMLIKKSLEDAGLY